MSGMRIALIAAVAFALSGGNALAQPDMAATNDTPNPYESIEGWAKMPSGRTWGSTSAVEIAADGTIWVASAAAPTRVSSLISTRSCTSTRTAT